MIKSVPFANAFTVVTIAVYVACLVLVYVAPDLLFSLAQSWFHGISLEAIRAKFTPSFGTVLLGLLSAGGLTWITTYAAIELYNRWIK